MTSKHRDALPRGTELEGYRIQDILGAGGFGITYKALELSLEREVALKEYLPSGIARRDKDDGAVGAVSGSAQEDFDWGLDRFRQEAKVLVALKHPNIVPVLRFFEANGTAYLAMEYQHGESLGAILKRDSRLDESEILELVSPILEGLETVHRAGFLHRDIKPDNIFIREDGTPLLIDFGSARQALGQHSRTLTAVISEGYAPYEQYQASGEQGPPTDIYALGAVMYRCVTGDKPPDAPSRVSARVKDSTDPMTSAAETGGKQYSAGLLAAIDGALAVFEQDRPQTVAEFRSMLPQPAPDLSGPAATVALPQTPQKKPARPGRRRPAVALLSVVALLAVVAVGAAAVMLTGGEDDTGGETGSTGEETAAGTGEDEAAARLAERQRQEEEARRQTEEQRQAEEARREAEAEAARQAEERRREEEVRLRAEEQRQTEEARRRAEAQAAEAEAARQAEEQRQADEARRQAEAEAARQAEERRREEEEARRAAGEEAARRETAERERQAAEESSRRETASAEEEAARQANAQGQGTDLRSVFAGRVGYMNKEASVGFGTANMRFSFRANGAVRFSWQVISSGSPESGTGSGSWRINGEQVCVRVAQLDGGQERCYSAAPAPDRSSVQLSGPGELAGRMQLTD